MTTGKGSWKHSLSVGDFMSFTDAGDEDIIIGFQGGNKVPIDMEGGDGRRRCICGLAWRYCRHSDNDEQTL